MCQAHALYQFPVSFLPNRIKVARLLRPCDYSINPDEVLHLQYRSKVTWQSLKDSRHDIFEHRVLSRVSIELVAWLFLRRANLKNEPPLLCAVVTFLLKRSTASRIMSDYLHLFVGLCKNINAKHCSVPCPPPELVLCLPWHNIASTEPAKS